MRDDINNADNKHFSEEESTKTINWDDIDLSEFDDTEWDNLTADDPDFNNTFTHTNPNLSTENVTHVSLPPATYEIDTKSSHANVSSVAESVQNTYAQSDFLSANTPSSSDQAEEFKNSSLCKIIVAAIIICFFLAFRAFDSNSIFSGIIATAQTTLLALSWLCGMSFIKIKLKNIHILLAVAALVLAVPYFSFQNIHCTFPSATQSIVWVELDLSEKLPSLDNAKGIILSDSEKQLRVDIPKISKSDYKDYVKKCEDMGYIIDAEFDGTYFNAFNEDGYELSLSYVNKKMSILLVSPMKMDTIKWPESGMASLIPAPESSTGIIEKNNQNEFKAYIGNMPREDFNAYVISCADYGFNLDANSSSKNYTAMNDERYRLSVEYQGFNIVCITMLEPIYEITIEVDCEENWIFSKYDVDVYIDDWFKGTIKHGTTETYTVALKKGTYVIEFVSTEDSELTGEIKFNVDKNEDLKFKISCSSFGIDVETVNNTVNNESNNGTSTSDIPAPETSKITVTMSEDDLKGLTTAEAESKLKEMGFTVFKYDTLDAGDRPDLDGKIGAVEIKSSEFGQGDFSKGDTYESDVIVVLWSYDYTEPKKPDSEYEKAYIRDMSNYDLYYMFDTDNKTVVFFGTNDTYVDKGTYSGDFATGITITWSHGEWTEKFIHKSGSLATVIDGNGWDWEYKVCDVDAAQKVLDELK